MRFLRILHTGYGFILFTILFILVFPLLLVPIIFPSQFRWTGIINRWWARLLFTGIFIPFRVQYRGTWNKTQPYVFCPNHFSYLDIPAVALAKHNSIFVGKSEMENIPLFGYMYKKLHITVDRRSLKSRLKTIKRSLEAVDEGKSLVIFPEGGIVTKKEPVMARFKDGAFRVAIEKQIPLVPVTIPYNWIILPPDEFLLRWHPLHVIFHEPVPTEGMTLADLDTLKDKVFAIIKEELTNHIGKRT
jgi:1-acyl-sn-glycerol-3-phosphate acyltransferase